MKRTNRREVITVSQRMLNFANLPEINSPKKVDEILCPDDPVGWNPLAENDFHGRASLVDLHELTQERLGELVSGGARTRKRILDKVVKDVRDASAQANVYGIIIPLPCVPEIVVDEGGAVMVRNQWLTTGAHAAVIFGLLELFVDGLVDDLARCNHCTHFYLQTPKLWIACSSACKQKLRSKTWRQTSKSCDAGGAGKKNVDRKLELPLAGFLLCRPIRFQFRRQLRSGSRTEYGLFGRGSGRNGRRFRTSNLCPPCSLSSRNLLFHRRAHGPIPRWRRSRCRLRTENAAQLFVQTIDSLLERGSTF